jgi:two-component system nitrate/nitrite response regulator NarL
MLQVYTHLDELITRLQGLYDEVKVCHNAQDIEPSQIVICDVESAQKLLEQNNQLRVIALSEFPNFTQGQSLLQKGLKGYANFYIHKLHLDQAIELINSGNMWLYPAFMQELISASRPQELSSDALLATLTQRERETALEVAKGKTNKEIAQGLNITERTVKAHLSSIFEKTGLSDRLTLAMRLKV